MPILSPVDIIVVGVGLACAVSLSGWACRGVYLMARDIRDWMSRR